MKKQNLITTNFTQNKSKTMPNVAKRTKAFWYTSAITALAIVMPLDMGLVGSQEASAQNIIKVERSAGSQNVMLGLDKSIVLDLPADAHDILVANPDVADAVMRTSRRIYLFGKEVGSTNIFVFDKDGNQVVSLDLRIERDVANLDRHLERFIPGSDITTEIINDNIVLTGRVQTPQDSARAAQLAEIFLSGGDATTQDFFSFFTSGNSQIVNLLEIAGGDQVTLKVTVAEIQRTVVKQLGINLLGSGTSSDGISFSGISESVAGALGKPLTYSGGAIAGAIGSVNLNAYFRAMEEAGVMKTLASPTLTAISGESATFNAGGTYNVIQGSEPGEDGAGTTYNISQIDYGVELDFTPVVLSPGRISLRIRTAVSEPTTEGSVPLSVGASAGPATNVLSMRNREAETTVELPSGGSMMIAGLIRDDVRQVVSGFPGLSKLPVLGTLFRSRDFVRNESELIIMVTPYLVRPVAQTDIALPTDNFAPPSDAAGNMLGRVNRIYGSVDQNMPKGRYHGAVGFIYK